MEKIKFKLDNKYTLKIKILESSNKEEFDKILNRYHTTCEEDECDENLYFNIEYKESNTSWIACEDYFGGVVIDLIDTKEFNIHALSSMNSKIKKGIMEKYDTYYLVEFCIEE